MKLRSVVRALVITMLAGLVATSAHAGDPCKKLKPYTDAFGVESRGVLTYVGLGGYQAVSLVEAKGDVTLTVMHVMPGVVDKVVDAGTEAQLMLADGTLLTVPSTEASDPVSNANGASVFTQWQIKYVLDDAALGRLGVAGPTAVRTSVGSNEVSFTVATKKGKRLMEAAGCLLADRTEQTAGL